MHASNAIRSRRTERRVARMAPACRRASVLIIVLVTLVFASVALVAFMDKATNDLLVDQREVIDRRLRMEAYSALETTLAVLEDFRLASNGLHSPAEGWSDPLAFAGYAPSEDRVVQIAFEDESGKISLPRANAEVLSKLFENWNVSQADADMLADALLGWMKRDHVYTTAVMPDYEQGTIPYEPPLRSLRSYGELAAIEKVREFFYDAEGRPNDYWRRFVASVSLFDFSRSNINGARPDVLAAIGQYDPTQQQQLSEYLSGKGQYETQGPGYFDNVERAQTIAGPGGNAGAFGTTLSALRINVTVLDGRSEFRLSAVIAPPNSAKTVQQTATSQRLQASASSAQTSAQRQVAPNASQPAANAQNGTQDLRYPFTLLEIRENDEIPPAPSLPSPESTS